MNPEDIEAMKKEIVALLEPYTEEGRKRIMLEVGDHFCSLCWTTLNGEKCYCAPRYDE